MYCWYELSRLYQGNKSHLNTQLIWNLRGKIFLLTKIVYEPDRIVDKTIIAQCPATPFTWFLLELWNIVLRVIQSDWSSMHEWSTSTCGSLTHVQKSFMSSYCCSKPFHTGLAFWFLLGWSTMLLWWSITEQSKSIAIFDNLSIMWFDHVFVRYLFIPFGQLPPSWVATRRGDALLRSLLKSRFLHTMFLLWKNMHGNAFPLSFTNTQLCHWYHWPTSLVVIVQWKNSGV